MAPRSAASNARTRSSHSRVCSHLPTRGAKASGLVSEAVSAGDACGEDCDVGVSPPQEATTVATIRVRRVRIGRWAIASRLILSGVWARQLLSRSISRNIPTSTAGSVRSSSQSIRSSAKARDFGFTQNSPIRTARSKSGSIRTWSTAGSRSEGIQALTELLFGLLQAHGIGTLAPTSDSPGDSAPKVSLGWARVPGGRDGPARLPATYPGVHWADLDMSRLRGLVGVQGGRGDRGRAVLLDPSGRRD
jgi:hypothetical protein